MLKRFVETICKDDGNIGCPTGRLLLFGRSRIPFPSPFLGLHTVRSHGGGLAGSFLRGAPRDLRGPLRRSARSDGAGRARR